MLTHISVENLSNLLPPSLIMLGLIGIFLLGFFIINKSGRNSDSISHSVLHQSVLFIAVAVKKPFMLLFFSYLLLNGFILCGKLLPIFSLESFSILSNIVTYLLKINMLIGFFWAVFNFLNEGQLILAQWLIKNDRKTLSILLSMVSKSLKAAILLLLINMIIPELGFTHIPYDVFEKLARVSLIVILAWLLVQIVNGLEKIIINQYHVEDLSSITNRKVNTQVSMLKRVVLSLATIVTLAAILMVFDSVRHLGEGILTTAGVVSAVAAFASQQSLSRIFSGLQLAFTQPIRIGDTVIIDNEFGQIEEITLSYIVVKLWDLRRLILPSDYFANKGLQNLTRSSTDLIGSVFLYVDYSLPIEAVRSKLQMLLSQSKLWNGKVSILQVTEMQAEGMELRALVSAENASHLWDLRCEVREELIKFIIKSYPHCLVKKRTLNVKEQEWENANV